MTEKELSKLIEKYLNGDCSEEEKRVVEKWYNSFDNFERGIRANDDLFSVSHAKLSLRKRIGGEKEKSSFISGRRRSVVYRIAVAASLLAFIALGYYFLERDESKPVPGEETEIVKNDLLPGGKKAVLKLANGQQFILDSSGEMVLAREDGLEFVKNKEGELVVKDGGIRDSRNDKQRSENELNTIIVPKGGQFKLGLSDGTIVWLNAGSMLRFPTAFSGSTREVEMNGEAYFEVNRNPEKPFIVRKGDFSIRVLGTKFNVKAYDNDITSDVSLLEGSVQVESESTHSKQKIVPGEGVQINKDNRLLVMKDINLGKVIAWKNNTFWFENSSIEEVVEELARWYDVKIEVQGEIPDLFTGFIPMDLTFSEVIELLKSTGRINYQLKDKNTVIITA